MDMDKWALVDRAHQHGDVHEGDDEGDDIGKSSETPRNEDCWVASSKFQSAGQRQEGNGQGHS